MTEAYDDESWYMQEPPGEEPDNVRPIRADLLSMRDQLLSRQALARLPEPRPLIHRTLDMETVAILGGYWGTFKSFLALDWAATIATGHRWQHRGAEKRRVLYIAGEGAHGIHKRLLAWEQNHQVQIPDDALTVLPRPVQLVNHVQVRELCSLVEGDGYGFVVVDTISKSIVGADENSAKDMSIAVNSLYLIRDAAGDGSVVGVHHTGKDKVTMRGSSVLEAGVDTVYQVEGDGENLRMSRTKRKDGPREDVLNLKFFPVPGTDSGVVDEAIPSEGGSDSARRVLAVFEEAFSETGASRAQLAEAAMAAGVAKTSVYRGVNELVRSEHLVNQGSQRLPFYVRPAAL